MFPLLLNVKTPLRFILDVIVVGTCLNPLVNARAVYIPVLDGQTQSVTVNTTGNTVNNVILPVPTTGIEPDALVTGLNVTGTVD